MKNRIHVGCCGFPTSRSQYARTLDLVEVQQTFSQPPRPATAERWREEARPGFNFTLKAWQLITHEPTSPTYRRLSRPIDPARAHAYGSFRDSDEVWEAWKATEAIAAALSARAVLFQCPPSFRPTEQNRRNLRRFFEQVPRSGWLFAFEPRGLWEATEVAELCRELDLVHARDPLHGEPTEGGEVAYFRLHGPASGRYRYADHDLELLAERCRGYAEVYCLFNNVEMARDAARFARLVGAAPSE